MIEAKASPMTFRVAANIPTLKEVCRVFILQEASVRTEVTVSP